MLLFWKCHFCFCFAEWKFSKEKTNTRWKDYLFLIKWSQTVLDLTLSIISVQTVYHFRFASMHIIRSFNECWSCLTHALFMSVNLLWLVEGNHSIRRNIIVKFWDFFSLKKIATFSLYRTRTEHGVWLRLDYIQLHPNITVGWTLNICRSKLKKYSDNLY